MTQMNTDDEGFGLGDFKSQIKLNFIGVHRCPSVARFHFLISGSKKPDRCEAVRLIKHDLWQIC
jgi:hypothetical protein